jgi:hypothetical protein
MLIHSLKVAKRVILIVIGFTLLAAGLVMSVPLVPGPGLLVVIGALAILAVELVWARRLLDRVEEHGSRLRERFGSSKNAGAETSVAVDNRRSEHASETKSERGAILSRTGSETAAGKGAAGPEGHGRK